MTSKIMSAREAKFKVWLLLSSFRRHYRGKRSEYLSLDSKIHLSKFLMEIKTVEAIFKFAHTWCPLILKLD